MRHLDLYLPMLVWQMASFSVLFQTVRNITTSWQMWTREQTHRNWHYCMSWSSSLCLDQALFIGCLRQAEHPASIPGRQLGDPFGAGNTFPFSCWEAWQQWHLSFPKRQLLIHACMYSATANSALCLHPFFAVSFSPHSDHSAFPTSSESLQGWLYYLLFSEVKEHILFLFMFSMVLK